MNVHPFTPVPQVSAELWPVHSRGRGHTPNRTTQLRGVMAVTPHRAGRGKLPYDGTRRVRGSGGRQRWNKSTNVSLTPIPTSDGRLTAPSATPDGRRNRCCTFVPQRPGSAAEPRGAGTWRSRPTIGWSSLPGCCDWLGDRSTRRQNYGEREENKMTNNIKIKINECLWNTYGNKNNQHH